MHHRPVFRLFCRIGLFLFIAGVATTVFYEFGAPQPYIWAIMVTALVWKMGVRSLL